MLHVLSREPRDADILNGRIDGEKVAALIEGAGRAGPPRRRLSVGPDAMMTSCRAALEAAGVAAGLTATEHFTPAARLRRDAPARMPKTEIVGGVAVQLGRRRDAEFTMDPARQTVLSAGRRPGWNCPIPARPA